MTKITMAGWIGLGLALLAGPPAYGRNTADIIFHNGVVVTMDDQKPQAQAIAVRGEKILDVGSDDEILSLQGPETIVVDLEGKTVLPGFVDPHTHIFNDAEMYFGMSLEEVQELELQNGITAIGDPYIAPDFINVMLAFDDDGLLRIRTTLYLIYTDPCGGIIGDWYTQYPPTVDPWAMLRIGGVKIFADGGVCGMPAVSFEYPDSGGHGDLWFTQEEMNRFVAEIDSTGYQVIIHAIGDLAIEQAQNALESVLMGGPNTRRHRIDHNSFVREDLLPRYSEIGVVAAIFGYFPTCAEVNDSLLSQIYGAEPLRWCEDWRRFLDANPQLPITWHGDDPWVGPISPLEEMYSMVTRREVDEDGVSICEPPDWLAEHTITASEALPLMNRGGAYALFREEVLGSLTAGKYADLVVLSDNPLTVDPDSIRTINVLMTMVGGGAEYCRPGESALCGAFEENLALNRPVTASASLPTNPPEMAVDGDIGDHWGAGDFAPQWIEIDLQAGRTIDNIKLVVDQSPPGDTRHTVWGKGPGPGAEYTLLHEFDRLTRNVDILSYTTPEPWRDIQYIKVQTEESPSWVSWREIEIIHRISGPVGFEEPHGVNRIPHAVRLEQNAPNPFNPSTTITYDLDRDAVIRLEVFSVRGRRVRVLVEDEQTAGGHSVTWDGRGNRGVRVASGVYICRLTVTDSHGTSVETRKMVAVK